MTETELVRRQRESQRGFYRAIANGSPGAELVELDGVQATLVPARKWFSIFNSALYRHPPDLERAHPALAAAYQAAGIKAWTVWVPPGDSQTARILEARGHVLDSTPMLFAAPIEALDLKPRMNLDLEPDPSWQLVARINDQAHGVLEPWTMAAVFETIDDTASHLYAARKAGAVVSALIAREHERDCYFWFVATTPEVQGEGIATELMRTALRDARGRGCTTSTLESTKAGEKTYARLGYKPLGRYEMWESRTT